jgi:hypothetical protein
MTTRSKRVHSKLAQFAVLAVLGSCAIVSARGRDLTVEEARRLVIEALQPTQRSLPGLTATLSQRSSIPDFYRFEVYWNPPNPGSAVVGYFAVNRVTGDVWELVLCEKKDSEELRRLQDELRKTIGLSDEELQKRTDEAPCEP